jgi:hypothetical protein
MINLCFVLEKVTFIVQFADALLKGMFLQQEIFTFGTANRGCCYIISLHSHSGVVT